MNVLAGWVHALRGGGLDPGTTARGMGAIERAVKAQTRLIEDLLDFSRMTMGKMRLAQRPTDVAAVVHAVVETVRAAADAKDIRLTVTEDTGSTTVMGDPDRLQQVVWNLVSNAIKFTPRGGRIEVSMGRVGTQLHVKVSDTGQGIAGDFLPHVFERFRQAQSGPSRMQGGLGLGLAIVKQIVELHGGSVHVESAGNGQGASFTVELPIPALLTESAEAPTEPKTSREVRAALDQGVLQGVRMLIVEDEPDGRDMLVALLVKYGAEVTAVSSAAEALEALQSAVPDVLVSDVGLPGEDGYELMRRVRALPPDRGGRVPSLALTAYTGPDDVTTARAAGFDSHLGKPAIPNDLARQVAVLAGRTGEA